MELARYKLDVVGVQEGRWDKGCMVRAGDYIFFCGKGNKISSIGNWIFLHHRIVSTFKRVEFISVRISYPSERLLV